jgi:ribosomal protein L7/L12
LSFSEETSHEVEKILGCLALTIAAATCARGVAADEKKPDAVRSVVILEGKQPAKVKVGEIVRVMGSGPSGMVEITARTKGPVKLFATNDVRKVVNGQILIGAMIKEFEVRATKPGHARVFVTINNKIQKTTETKEFKIEVEQSP